MGRAPAAGAKLIQPIVPEQRPRHGTPTRVPRVQEAPRAWGSRCVTPASRLPQVTGRGLGSRRDPQDRRTLGLEQRPRRAAEQELPSERGFLPGHGRLLARGVILGDALHRHSASSRLHPSGGSRSRQEGAPGAAWLSHRAHTRRRPEMGDGGRGRTQVGGGRSPLSSRNLSECGGLGTSKGGRGVASEGRSRGPGLEHRPGACRLPGTH